MQQQPYNLPGPSPMSLQQPFVMAQQQQGWEVDRKYENIMSLNYGRNPFVQKNDINNGNVYRFKFRGKEVCITLYHNMQNILYMHVDGNGSTEWCDAAIPILDKQCERHERERSREFQISEAFIPETADESKKELVSEELFRKCFANPYAYGKDSPKPWPDSTILLYKYSSNATTKYWDIPEDTWKRIDNDKGGKHAEEKMIEDLKEIQEYLTIQPDDYEGGYKAILSVEVISSYSPCDGCSDKLYRMKKIMDKKVKQSNEKVVQISKTRNKGTNTVLEEFSALSLTTEIEEKQQIKLKITFSNFYKHLKKYNNQNMEGLKSLLKGDIKLDIFTDENWDYFFNAAGLVTARPWRQRRERDDKNILQYLKGLVTYESMPSALKAMEEELRKNGLL